MATLQFHFFFMYAILRNILVDLVSHLVRNSYFQCINTPTQNYTATPFEFYLVVFFGKFPPSPE